MNYLDCPFELKRSGPTGSFEGYASIFGNVDQGGDVVDKGAFKEFVKNEDGRVVVLWQHRTGEPIGTAEVSQDDKGLAFKGQLVLDDPKAAVARAHMQAKSVTGMSIGYDVLPGGAEFMNSGVRLLKALKLWEISVVTFGMNPAAQIDRVKRAGAIQTIRDFEDFLRDEGGFTNAQAKRLAVGGFSALQARRDDGDVQGAIEQLLRGIDSIRIPSF